MALAASGFSAVNLQAVRKLGVRLTEEESVGYMHIWRYVTWLLGVPEEILFAGEHEAVHLKEVGYACEPRPSTESITLAHAIVNCVPDLMGMEDGPKRKRLIDFLFRTSRALLGDDMADALEYPPQFTLGVLPFVRMQQRYKALRLRMPGASHYDSENFAGLLQRSVYDDIGMSYRMPDALREAESSAW